MTGTINPPLRLLIVDDEAPARARLRDLLGDINGELPNIVVGEATDGVEALEFLSRTPATAVDIALVDIRMPRLDGIGLAQQLAVRREAPAVIFTTAYDEYAVRAFDLNAIDYLLKPVRASRLLTALNRLPRGTDAAALRHLAPEGRTHLHSNERGRIHLVPLTDILFLRAELKYVTAQTREREYLIEESLSHLEEEFGERFIRIHRNCLAARNAITGVERAASESGDSPDGGEARWMVLLRDFAGKLPVSRRQWSQVKALLREE
ncbi:MAG TPA: response regulator transcription factor [Rhodocyclaceae bacterium]|jgi:two-component system response regulator AlgR|nr:response regulator transcription factor [Rhodocyclaceae bacterium]